MNKKVSYSASFHSYLKDTFQPNHYYAACSFPFTELSNIPSAFHQAKLTLAEGHPESGQIYDCRQIAMKYISSIVLSHADIGLLHPVLEQMANYDATHKTSLYQTLFSYLKNERNHQRTSEELFIHRNTLFLRLNKITALWNLDLENPEERFYLLYSFYQQEYSGMLCDCPF